MGDGDGDGVDEHRIVVGVDGSPGSQAALAWAAAEARQRGAVLEALLAWQYPVLSTLPAYGVLPAIDDMEATARRAIDEALAAVGTEGLHVRELIAEGPAGPALVAAATGADLLVVGSRGHGAFRGMLLGSVSQHCVVRSPCPVVVVPVHEHDHGHDAG